MQTIRCVATLTLCCSAVAFAETAYPLSCNAAAKPLVFKGWDETSNIRIDEGRASLKKAVAADPKCVMARATLGLITPGAEGKKMFDEALTQTAGLSEVEKLDLKVREAVRNGETEKALGLSQQLVALAPEVYILQIQLATLAQSLQKWLESGIAAKRATELSPKSGAGWNMLGYASLNLHKHGGAVAAFRKYVEMAPGEPNAHDSLADAFLGNDQLDEAAVEYQKALDSSGGKFWWSWDGIATVKAIRGDWEGVRAALTKQKDSALDAADKVNANRLTAWAWVAQGKLAEGLAVLDGSEREASTARLDAQIARIQILRGQLQAASGRYSEALEAFASAEKFRVDELTDGQKKYHRALSLSGLAEAQARLGKVAEAEKSVGALETFFRTNLGGPFAADVLAYNRGLLALAKKDAKAAAESLKKCTEVFDFCRLALIEAQEKAGDAPGAAATRSALAKANHREPEYWVVRAQLEAQQKTPGKKVAAEGAKK